MTDEKKRRLGLTVQAARKRVGLTQEGLAARIGRTPESVSNIGRGVHLPTLDTVLDLARVLGVPAAEFFAEAGVAAGLSRERLKLEAQMREITRGLSDTALEIAVAQARVLLNKPL